MGARAATKALLLAAGAGLATPAAAQIRLTDIAARAGVDHVVRNSETPERYQIEPMIAGVALFDYDNDGRLDIYWGNSDYPGTFGLLYHQDSPGHFEAVPIADGIDHHRSHGVAVADFNHDGALDVVVGHSFARCDDDSSLASRCYGSQLVRLLENVYARGGNFIELTLAGAPGTNAAAIGARVTAVAGGNTQTREIGGGYGHYGAQNDLTVHFGLGTACEAAVTVRWPDAAQTTQTFTLPAGYAFSLAQGGSPRVLWPVD